METVPVVLTFDDGPGPSTEALLDALAERGVRAVFFLLGCNVERRYEVAVRIAREGHVLANHTYSHARAGAISAEALVEEIERTDRLLLRAAQGAGRSLAGPLLLRLPYGASPGDPRIDVLARMGRRHTDWTAHFHDWEDHDPVELAARMRAHIEEQRSKGATAVLDLHDGSRHDARRDATVEAVRLLLRDPGACIFTLPA